ncbi:hypothetical protein [Halorientalis regularis]|uniref:hypothetical protein n=1 Tax=Halorientalis regularis TaxID=660518 RepID=UPI002032B282|nr:hypothetical protein [Halorientalis regularis]
MLLVLRHPLITRYQTVKDTLQQAHNKSGDHWEAGELTVTLETPQGEAIEVILDLEQDPAANAQQRYERAKQLEAELEQQQAVVGQLAPLPADPVAYRILYVFTPRPIPPVSRKGGPTGVVD